MGIRADIVGEEVYACGIVSDADDDRYAARQSHDAEITPGEAPEWAERCLALTRFLPALASRASWWRPSLSRGLETARRKPGYDDDPIR